VSDVVGLSLSRTLALRAAALPPGARLIVLARAEALRERYQHRAARTVSPPSTEGRAAAADAWRDAIQSRAHHRALRAPADPATPSFIAELRASTATARAASQVPASAGPYNGAAVASRAMGELVALAPSYVSNYVAWLEDLACLAELPERRATPRKG